MKETVKVNLSGHLFNLDIDAYERLKKYLDSIERQFIDSPDEAKEILEDIESRIAELLHVKFINSEKQVVTLSDVNFIIEKLGTAEDIGGHEEEAESKDNSRYQEKVQYTPTRKRLYRDTDNSIFGGVSSGLAAYLGIDPIWIRLLFIVLFFAKLSGLLIYIILWAVIPEAKTTAQKLEMRGEDVNVENIKNSVKSEYIKVKEGVKNFSKSKEYRKAENAIAEFFKILGNILVLLIKVIGIIVIVSLIIGLISIFFGFAVGGAFFFPRGLFHGWNWNLSHEIYWPHLTWVSICLMLVIVIPILALFAKMVRWMFSLPNKSGVASAIAATVWAVAFFFLVVLLINDPNKDLFRNKFTTEYTFSADKSKVLKIDLKYMDSDYYNHYHVFGKHYIWDDKNDELLKNPTVEILEGDNDEIKLKLQREFFCLNPDKSRHKINSVVHYNWSMEENTLNLGEYFSSNEVQTWRFPRLKVMIYLPEGKEFYYTDELSKMIEEIIYLDDSRIDGYAEKVLEIENDRINDKN